MSLSLIDPQIGALSQESDADEILGNGNGKEKDFLLKSYLRDISKVPILSRNDEHSLAVAALSGDEVAKEKLISANLRFVVTVAKKFQNQGISLIDLISEGNLGLIHAVDKFDPYAGNHFISYAVWWIRQSILKALSEKSRLIRIPVNKINDLIHIEKEVEIRKNCGEVSSMENLSNKLHMTKDKIHDVLNLSHEFVSFDYEVNGNSTLNDFVPDMSKTPDQITEINDVAASINEVLGTLSEKEQKVIKLRFGLDGDEPMSLLEIGKLFNLTKERIRQIEKKALRKLRHPIRSDRLRSLTVA